MSHFAVCSVKGAPGATTLALAMTCALTHAEGQGAALVEADPAGGAMAALLGLAVDPGLVSLAAASRHHSAWPDAAAHGQALPAGGWVLLGSTDPAQAAATIDTLASRLSLALGVAAQDAVFDCGRWSSASPVGPLLLAATATAVCVGPSVAAIEAVRVRAGDLWDATGGRVGLVVIGRRVYSPEQIEASTGLPVVGEVGWDGRACAGLIGATRHRVERSQLVRTARTITERLDALGPPTLQHPRCRPCRVVSAYEPSGVRS